MSNKQRYIGSGKKWRKYTDEEIRQVRQTDMLDFLGQFKGFTFKRVGKVYICTQHDSLVVQADRQRWLWYSLSSYTSKEAQGLNVLDYLEKMEGMSWQDAMAFMLDKGKGVARSDVNTAELSKKEEKEPFVMPEKDTEQFRQVFAYLCKTRCIDQSIVSYCVKHDLIYQEKNYKNAVFAGYDENGEMKFAESKVTNQYTQQFNINVTGSDKAYSFNITNQTADTDKSTVFVFEAPIDLLSHATMTLMVERKRAAAENRTPDNNVWLKQNRLSLSGRSSWVLEKYLERNPEIQNIVLCLDNDVWGQKSVAEMTEQFGGRYNVKAHHAKHGKDYNECLQYIVNGTLPAPKEQKLSQDTQKESVSHDKIQNNVSQDTSGQAETGAKNTIVKAFRSKKVKDLEFYVNADNNGFAELDGVRVCKLMQSKNGFRAILFKDGYKSNECECATFNEVLNKAVEHAMSIKADKEELDLTRQAQLKR